ncbi:MAG: 16S rRNA (guanine(966)-N(2))-methyltransferase RsmD [Schwartzia sp. (in: firmicutes)]
MRIITGTARGARLKAPKGIDTRPTADRVKESLFSILGERVRGARVLDLFAGTGGLGLEALSRGAVAAVFVDRATIPLIRDNAAHTHLLENARFLRQDVFSAVSFLAAAGERFDLIFCDPPYEQGLWQRVLSALDGSPLLSSGALLMVECGAGESAIPPLSALSLRRAVGYGRTTKILMFEPCAAEKEA